MNLICDCCGKLTPSELLHRDSRHQICDECYRKSYTRCAACQAMIHVEDAYHTYVQTYCFSCYSDLFQSIHPHDYKPSPVFYGATPRFFGVELEIDDGGHSDENARILLETVNTDAEYIYINTDQSLRDGLEIVTHPMTLDFHLHRFDWATLMKTAEQLGYHADDADTCGLHIHVNRSSLGHTPSEQADAANRIQAYMQAHQEQMRLFSRRKPEYWMNPNHTMINLQHPDTVEFRLFQSTLQTKRLFQALHAVEQICAECVSILMG